MLKVHEIECRVVRSARRSAAIYVERDGSVTVRAPVDLDEARLTKLVEKKLPWIYRNVALWRELNRNVPHREFVSGETFYVEGQPCLLDVRDEASLPLSLEGNRLVVKRNALGKADELLKAMYRQLGYERLPRLIETYASRIGVKPGKLRVWELHNRWASCSVAGNLNFHWSVMTLPLDILEYLVAHEVVHLKHRNHTKEFWSEVERIYPGWRVATEWLRTNGAGRSL
ncbi:M48 family metallopeptidase [Ralstonia pseudosolanacearum]|uniref:M48 family metallopeptidase n=1 Tax=Ralstonia pseudosolanacearum TaxID=1310165 RepID=UPI002002E0D9|nr:SprT family zinc-dependent metalloprotease [Ralstonia pseudosolanacearum]MCK4143619.1 M48 family metallopeptidase [Ralstonia pseudosolanacearum]